jgi:hypothetical protein
MKNKGAIFAGVAVALFGFAYFAPAPPPPLGGVISPGSGSGGVTSNQMVLYTTNNFIGNNRGAGTNIFLRESTGFYEANTGAGLDGFFIAPGATFNDFIVSGSATTFRLRAPTIIRGNDSGFIMTWQDASQTVVGTMSDGGVLNAANIMLGVFSGGGLQMPYADNTGLFGSVDNLTALQSIRVNAAGTGFEAFVPDSGSGGTNTWYKAGDDSDAIRLGNDGSSSLLLRIFSSGVGGAPSLTIDNSGNFDTTGNISLTGGFTMSSFSGGGLQMPFLTSGGNISVVQNLLVGQSIRVDTAGTGFEAFSARSYADSSFTNIDIYANGARSAANVYGGLYISNAPTASKIILTNGSILASNGVTGSFITLSNGIVFQAPFSNAPSGNTYQFQNRGTAIPSLQIIGSDRSSATFGPANGSDLGIDGPLFVYTSSAHSAAGALSAGVSTITRAIHGTNTYTGSIAQAPVNIVTPAGWMPMTNAGNLYYIPLYQ